jgi:glyoxylase-like metal-dependent hydrolase (beta-lactamase superfamily II)
MPRILTPAALVAAGVALLAAYGPLHAQESRIVRMQTLNVRDILYVLTGGGGNTLALMRDDGVVLIDSKLPGWGRSLAETIQAVTDKPVTVIINTHAHEDHTGGNVDFPTATKIVAHQNAKASMQKMPAFSGANAKYLPNTLVSDRMSLLDGPDRIELYYFGRAHTDGDLVVVFPEKRLAHLGDLFPGKAAPVIDTANGGSAVEFPRTLARIVAEITNVVRVTTGHDDATLIPANKESGSAIFANPKTMTWKDLQEYVDFNNEFLAAVRQAIAEGKTAADAFATLRMPDRFKAYDMRQAKANVEAIYRELGR